MSRTGDEEGLPPFPAYPVHPCSEPSSGFCQSRPRVHGKPERLEREDGPPSDAGAGTDDGYSASRR
jgi:hypothetical protein